MDRKPIFEFWAVAGEEVIARFKSSPKGLSAKEVVFRLKKFGRNEIKARGVRGAAEIFIAQFKNPLILILLGASAVSGFLGEIISMIIIFAMIIISSAMAFVQEYRSEKTMERLKAEVSAKASVFRAGKIKLIDSRELVLGDIVLLEVGGIVPADLRIIAAKNLTINESILTGESFPAEKDSAPQQVRDYLPAAMRNLAFAGTAVAGGFGRGIVIGTGNDTELGKTAKLLEEKTPDTQFQRGIAEFGFFLFRIILLFSLAIFLFLAVFKGNWLESLLFSLAIAVGISPELLPIIITINLSRGARKMSKKKVIVKRLMAIENLGNIDVLCTDKTGTLTEGRIILKDYYDFEGKSDKSVLKYAQLANSGFINTGTTNPLDEAIWRRCAKSELRRNARQYKIIDDLPFDFARRRIGVVVEKGGQKTLIVKGAADEILDLAGYVSWGGKVLPVRNHLARIKEKISQAEEDGFKVLLVGFKAVPNYGNYSPRYEKGLTLSGLLVFADPPKKTARHLLQHLNGLGIKMKLLTGDSDLSAQWLSREVGLKFSKIISGARLDKMSEEKLKAIVEKYDIFARVTPEHKLRIVKALKERGHQVGFLGDGANDAPALRAADVGVSVDSAVDVAKEAADVILLKKSLSVLLDGIIEGRRTFGNTLKYIFCTISSNYGNMFSVAGAALILPFIPMLPVQVLLLNFISDFPMLAISTDEVDADYLKKPKQWDIRKIRRFMNYFGLISSLFDFITFGFLLVILHATMSVFQAGWFLQSFFTEILIIFVIRTKKWFWQSRPGKILAWSAVAATVAVFALLYTPAGGYFGFGILPWPAVLAVGGIAMAYFLVIETTKKFFYSKLDF